MTSKYTPVDACWAVIADHSIRSDGVVADQVDWPAAQAAAADLLEALGVRQGDGVSVLNTTRP